MIAEQKIKDIIASFLDPITGTDLLSAGRLEAVAVNESQLIVTLVVPPSLATHFNELTGALTTALREALQLAESNAQVRVILTATTTGSRQKGAESAGEPLPTHQPLLKTSGPKNQHIDISGMRHIIAVASGKGGVGKSTVAVNLAAALAASGQRVGLLDADIYGPSVPHMLRLTEKPEVGASGKLQPLVLNGLKVMSIGLLVEPEKALIWRGPMVQGALVQMLRDVDWGQLDYLVIDLPPGTGDAQLTLAQQVRVSGAVIVSTPQDIALIDARKAVAMFQKTQVPILGLVENMSVFCCPNCGHQTHIFGMDGARAEAAKLGVPLLAEIPLQPEVRALSDAGTPPAWHGDEAARSAYHTLAAAVRAALP